MTQPIVAAYRYPMLQLVRDALATQGVSFHVLHPRPAAARAARADGASADWILEIGERRLTVLGVTFRWRRIPREHRTADLVVTELAAANLNAMWWALTGRRYVLWGHGKNYSEAHSKVAQLVETLLYRRSVAILTYMPSGAEHVVKYGASATKVQPFMNSTDTRSLRSFSEEATSADLSDFLVRHGLVDLPTALYVGGLDGDKRIQFLAEAIELIAAEDGVQVVVAGKGAQHALVESVASRFPNVHMFGTADRRDLALLGQISRLVMCPGKIGLVAVDALALGLPVVTAQRDGHAPEVEYLESGTSLLISEDTPRAFASLVLERLVSAVLCENDREIPSIESSAQTIAATLLDSLDVRNAAKE